MNRCADCIRGVAEQPYICRTAAVVRTFDYPVCPECGADITRYQEPVHGCKFDHYYTRFECGSTYVVFYLNGTPGTDKISIVSVVQESSECIVKRLFVESDTV